MILYQPIHIILRVIFIIIYMFALNCRFLATVKWIILVYLKFTVFLKAWDVQHGISLTFIIALIVIYLILIGHFIISANSMQFAFDYCMKIYTTHKLPIKRQHRENLHCVREQSERAWKMYALIRYRCQTPISFSVWIGTYEFCLHMHDYSTGGGGGGLYGQWGAPLSR